MAELIDFLMRLLKIGLGLCIFVGPFIWLIYAQREYNKAYGHEPDDDDGNMAKIISAVILVIAMFTFW